jgi:Fic family protein
MNALQEMQSSGQIGPQAWSLARSRVIEESMKGSDTLSGKGFAAQAELSRAQQSYRTASGLAGDLAAAKGPLTVGDLLAINSEVGRGGTYHTNIRDEGDSYGGFRSGTLPLSDQQGIDLLHPDPNRLPVLMQELVDRVNLDSMRLQHSRDTFAKVELAASAASRLLSIHPFPDGNARTAYQLMSLILERHGLPPAAMGQDARMIVHPGRGAQNPSQDDLVKSVVAGMERSLDVMEAALTAAASPPR